MIHAILLQGSELLVHVMSQWVALRLHPPSGRKTNLSLNLTRHASAKSHLWFYTRLQYLSHVSRVCFLQLFGGTTKSKFSC